MAIPRRILLLLLLALMVAPAAVGGDIYYRLKESLDALGAQERDIYRRRDVLQTQIDKLEAEKATLDEYLTQIKRTRKDVETAMDTAR